MNATTLVSRLLETNPYDMDDPFDKEPIEPAPDEYDPKEIVQNHREPKIKVDKIEVWGKRWFNRGPGNTYFVANIYVNDKLVHAMPMEYGYGDHYIYRAADWLEENGYIFRDHHFNGSSTPLWNVAQTAGFKLVCNVTDVKRQRDLFR